MNNKRELICNKCNRTYIYDRKRGDRLKYCGSCYNILRRNKLKDKAVEYNGGKCEICGYNKCNAVLSFHHNDPDKKESIISELIKRNVKWNTLKKEIDKCTLVCANCHGEIHHMGV